MKKNTKIINIMTTVVFVLFIFGFALLFIFKKADTVSETERRKLAQFPSDVSWEDIRDGEFADRMNEYLNDQFPFRDAFVSIKCDLEQLLLKRENAGVLVGDNGQLAVRLFNAVDGKIHPSSYVPPLTDDFFRSNLDGCMEILKKESDFLAENGIQTRVILPPRTVDVTCSAFTYPTEKSDALIKAVREDAGGLGFIDMYDIFRTRYDNGEYVYYRTDHHWTTLGAYYAYAEIMKSFGVTPYSVEQFEKTAAASDFYGTTASKCGDRSSDADVIEYWTLSDGNNRQFEMGVTNSKNGENYTMFDTFYDFSYLEGYDKYGMFLSGTNLLTKLCEKTEEERETVLLLKDSFGHSLAPFLALHYDVIVVNLEDAPFILTNFADSDIGKVIVCFNLENVVTTSYLANVKYISTLLGLD